MARAKRKAPATVRRRGELAQLAARVDAWREQHPNVARRDAVAQSGVQGIDAKAYAQLKYRERRRARAGGAEIPLDAIPARSSSAKGNGASYARRRQAGDDGQVQTALALLRLALRILERT
jgi:hypothetical protein